jgi:hypothetical protein
MRNKEEFCYVLLGKGHNCLVMCKNKHFDRGKIKKTIERFFLNC